MIDIFQLGKVINEKFPEIAELDSPEIDAAIEDISFSQKNLDSFVSGLEKLKRKDYDGFAQLLTDLKFSLEHMDGHIHEALPKLTTLWEQVSKKADERKINYGRS